MCCVNDPALSKNRRRIIHRKSVIRTLQSTAIIGWEEEGGRVGGGGVTGADLAPVWCLKPPSAAAVPDGAAVALVCSLQVGPA